MQAHVQNLGISTGGILIAVLNAQDARRQSFHQGDRILLQSTKGSQVAVLDITDNEEIVPKGNVGVFEELRHRMKIRTGHKVEIALASKPESLQYIRKKISGEHLSEREMRAIVQDIVDDRLTDIEKTYFVTGCYFHELSLSETAYLTRAMIDTGETLKISGRYIMDKHCIGGVAGNRTTAVVVPIVAAAGLKIPKTSSRSITSPAGTSDTMEVLCDVCLSVDRMRKVVKDVGGCLVWGGSMNLAPADDKIIKIEHPMSLDPVGQLLASILAKKKSVSATHVLIDIPLGIGAKIEEEHRALMLKHKFESLGKKLKMEVRVIISDGSEPIGNGIGPALEARDILWTLDGDPRGSRMLREKAIAMAGTLLEMGKKAKPGEGSLKAQELIDSGKAYKKFIDIIKAQGARYTIADKIPVGKFTHEVQAKRSGMVIHVDNMSISSIAKLAGASKDKGAGLYLYHHKGEHVEKGDVLFRIYAENKVKLGDAMRAAKKAKSFIIK